MAKDAWQGYRRRRAVFAFGLLAGVGGIAALHVLDAGDALVVGYAVVGLHLFFCGVWLRWFPCPACDHEWFGISHGEPAANSLSVILRMAAQKLCCHCGLSKFMDPAGWNRASVAESDGA